MILQSPDFHELVQTFAVATGVPAFVMDAGMKVLWATRGFSPTEYSLADFQTLPGFFDTAEKRAAYQDDQYYTLFTANEFVYNLVVCKGGDAEYRVFCGPVRLSPLTDVQLIALLKSHQISLRKKGQIAEVLARLPRVSGQRVAILGRVLWSLCHIPSNPEWDVLPKGSLFPPQNREPTEAEPKITFNLVDEETHTSFEFLEHGKHLLLTGDVAGLRALRDQNLSLPEDRLFDDDTVLSVRYRVIESLGALAAMIFDCGIPYEQMWIILDRYTRMARKAATVPELLPLRYEYAEALAWLVRKHSTQQYSKPVRQVVQHIQSHMGAKITLSAMSNLTGFSKSYLSRLVKKETGLSLIELLDKYRIEEAKYLLLYTDYSIMQIAELTGFEYQNYLSVRFKKVTGMTPTRYRQTAGLAHP